MRQLPLLLCAALLGGVLSASVVLWAVVHGADRAALAPASAPEAVLVSDARLNVAPELPTPVDLRAAARRAIPAVVHIRAATKGRQREAVKALFSGDSSDRDFREGEGSGVLYTSNGYVVTNQHVIGEANDITVTTANRKTYPASLVGADDKTDLAVLRIDGENLPYLELADSDAAEAGQWVLAVGNPLGLTSTVTAGIVSAKARSISLLQDLDAIESFLQTDAAVNPGNSGGALVAADGKLLGINTAIASRTGKFQGYSFAIPVNLVRRIADDIIEFGSYRRAYLGVEISTFTRADQRRLRLNDRTEGVVIDQIVPGGSAEAAGLRVDDLIVSADGRKIRDLPEITEIIGRAKVGQTLRLTVIRNKKPLDVEVPLLSGE